MIHTILKEFKKTNSKYKVLTFEDFVDYVILTTDRSPLVRTVTKSWDHVLVYFKRLPKNTLIAGTITIGNKYYGKKGAMDQLKAMQQAIKELHKYARYQTQNIKYFATFELQKNGQLHSHLILENKINFGLWREVMGKFGARNLEEVSFTPIGTNIDTYFKYITKNEDGLLQHSITNIKEIC